MATREVPEVKPAVQLDAAVFGATVQLPSFGKIEPNAWFAVADANFALRKVTDSMTRYYYVLSKLDATTLRKLSAFLNRPRGEDPYNDIERPMEFGLEMQRLLGDSSTDDILKRIFLRAAPPAIATAIKPFRKAKFEELLEAAEDAWATEASPAGMSTATVAAVSAPVASQRRGARGGRQRGGRSPGQPRMIQLCYFHHKFGDAAKRCAPACVRWGDLNRTRDATQVFQVEEVLDGEDADVGSEN